MAARGRTPRRPRIWGDTQISEAVVDDLIHSIDLTANLLSDLPSLHSTTIVRLIGEWAVRPFLQASTGFFRASAGIIVVTADALAVGGTSLPDPSPLSDPADWMWRYHINASNEPDNLGSAAMARYIPIDIRSARKMNQANKRLAFVFKRNTASSATHNVSMRLLCLT